MSLRKKKITPQTVKYFSRSGKGFRSHTERLTMHVLRYPVYQNGRVGLDSEDVGAIGRGYENLTYWICSE